jgi:Sigma-70, region 4
VQCSSALQQVSWQEVEAYERFFLSDVWEQAWSSVQKAELHTCLMQLPAEQREVIELAFFGGLTHCEIAQFCHMPIGTVKSRIRLGMSHLRRELEKEGFGKTLSYKRNYGKAKSGQAAPVIVQATEGGCRTGYELYREGSSKCFGYTEWEHLIEQIEMFEFRGTEGCFIARKEKRAHGRAYWYTYTWGSGGRRKTYLGRPAELTLARMEAMARKLNEELRSD